MSSERVFIVQKHMIALLISETTVVTQYLDYVNNFASVERFAEYYGYTLDSANFIINQGKQLQDGTYLIN